MPPTFFPDPDTTQGIFDRLDQNSLRWIAAQDRATNNPTLAARTVNLQAYYDRMGVPTGAIQAMANSGLNPGDPAADQFARYAAQQENEQENEGGGGLFGGISTALNWFGDQVIDPVKRNTWDFGVRNFVTAPREAFIPDQAGHVFRGAVRGALSGFEAAWEEVIARPHRTMFGTVFEGFDSFSEFAESTGGGGLLTGSTRNLDVLTEAASDPVGNLQGGVSRLYDSYKQSGESPLVSAIREKIETGNFNVGQGYLIGGEARQRSLDNNNLYLPNGDKITIGRAYAQVFEQGTAPYNLASGAIDAAAMIALDPANIALGGGANVAQARRAFKVPSSIKSMDDVKAYFGAFAQGDRLATDQSRFVDRFLTQERAGQKFVERLSATQDPENIWQMLGKPADTRIIRQARDITDPSDMREFLRGRGPRAAEAEFHGLGVDIPNRPRRVSTAAIARPLPIVRRSVQDMRLFDEIPGSKLYFSDPGRSLQTFDQYLKNANLEPSIRKNLFDRYVHAASKAEIDEVLLDMGREIDALTIRNPKTMLGAATDLGAELSSNYHFMEDVAITLADWSSRLETRSRQGIWHPEFSSVEMKLGDQVARMDSDMFSALTQAQGGYYNLPNFREIRKATSRLAPLLDAKLIRNSTNLLEKYLGVWKPLQLLRLAWLIRVGGENQVRLGAAGLSSAIRHPGDWINWAVASVDNPRMKTLLDKVTNEKGRFDVTGDIMTLDRALQGERAASIGSWMGEMPEAVRHGVARQAVKPGAQSRIGPRKPSHLPVEENEYLKLVNQELMKHGDNPISRNLAQGDQYQFRHRAGFSEEEEVFYHGTPRFDVGDERGLRVSTNPEGRRYSDLPDAYMGAYFSTNPQVANEYATISFGNVETDTIVSRLDDYTLDEIRADLTPPDASPSAGMADEATNADGTRAQFADRLERLVELHGEEVGRERFLRSMIEDLKNDPFIDASGVRSVARRIDESLPMTGPTLRANVDLTNPYTPGQVDIPGWRPGDAEGNFQALSLEAKRHYVDNIDFNDFLNDYGSGIHNLRARVEQVEQLVDDPQFRHEMELQYPFAFDEGASDIQYHIRRMAEQRVIEDVIDVSSPWTSGEALTRHIGHMYRDKLIDEGFDGVRMGDGETVIAFDDTQIRQQNFDEPPLTGMDAVKEWLWTSDEGAAVRRELAAQGNNPNGPSRLKALIDEDEARRVSINSQQPFEGSRQVSDYLVETTWNNLRKTTGNDSILLEAIASGQLDGTPLLATTMDQLMRNVESLRGRMNRLPDTVPTSAPPDHTTLRRWTEEMFDLLSTRPDNFWARAPAARQFYWDRVQQVMGRISPDLADDLAANARKSNVTIDTTHIGVDDVRINDLEDLDIVAGQYAADETRKLLYDLDRRGQWADIARNIMPFAEAWKEVLGTWGRLMTKRPQNIRRGQQVITGARGNDNDPTTGFFRTDPSSDREVFTYPLTGEAMAAVLRGGTGSDARFDAEGTVQGLNLVAGSMVPGLGPVADLAASAIIPDTSNWDWFRETLLPFGEQDLGTSPLGWLETASLPAWMEKWMIAFFGEDQTHHGFANTRMALVQHMINSGRYSPDEIDKAIQDSESQARTLYFLRGLAQFALPTGPTIEHTLEDADGHWHQIGVLGNELRKMRDSYGSYDQAIGPFIERFGIDPFLVSQPSTRTIEERAVETAGYAWERDNADHLATLDIDHVRGFFAPIDPENDEFEYQAWLDSREEGSTIPLTSDEQAQLYNSSVAMFEYRAMKDRLEQIDMPDDQRDDMLRSFRTTLRRTRPGFDRIASTLPSRPDFKIMVEELWNGVNDDVVGNTMAGQAIAHYLTTRERALEAADGVSLGGVRDRDIRLQLYEFGTQMAQQIPEFENVWFSLLRTEVDDVAEEEEVMVNGSSR